LTTFISAIAFLAFGFWLGRWQRGLAFDRGEAAVRRLLSQHFESPSYHLLSNVTLPVEDGTTQVDHILVSRFGLFVIEAKHYKGWLFANSGPKWTQVLFGKHYKFQNPVHQNAKHVRAVSGLLEFLDPSFVHSLVVFTGDATFKTQRPSGVMSLSDVAAFLGKFDNEVLSENRMQFCVGRLECCRRRLSRQTDIDHVDYLTRKFGEVD
jgi:restriction system protein